MPDLASARALISALPAAPATDLPEHLPGIIGPVERFAPGSEDLVINPRFAALVPPPAPEEWASTLASIRAEGILDLFFVRAGTREILDGHHRWPVAREHGYLFNFRLVTLPDEASCIEWIQRKNLCKKNLYHVAKADMVGRVYNARKERRGGDHKSNGSSGHNVRLINVARELAEQYGFDPRSIRRNGQFARCMDAIEANCGAEARGLLLRSDFRCSQRLLEALAAQPAEFQARFVQLLREGKVQHAKGLLQQDDDRPATMSVPREVRALALALKKRLSPKEWGQLRVLLQ